MITELLSPYCEAHIVDSYCKESNISDENWPRYLCSSYMIKTWLSVCRHHLANLHTFVFLYFRLIFLINKHNCNIFNKIDAVKKKWKVRSKLFMCPLIKYINFILG